MPNFCTFSPACLLALSINLFFVGLICICFVLMIPQLKCRFSPRKSSRTYCTVHNDTATTCCAPKLFSTGTDPDLTLQRVSADLTLIYFATDVNPDTKLNNLSPFPFLQFLLLSLHSLLLILFALYIFSSLSPF